MHGRGAVGQERINDLLREASRERLARQTRRSRRGERSSLARMVMAALQSAVRH